MASEELCSRRNPACPSCACHCDLPLSHSYVKGDGVSHPGVRGEILGVEDLGPTCHMSGGAEVTSQGQAESFPRAHPVAPLGLSRRWSVESVCLRLLPGKASSL